MNIVPAPIENYTKRIPRNIALWQGVAGIVIALWSLVMLIVLVYAASPFSIVEVPTGSLILGLRNGLRALPSGRSLRSPSSSATPSTPESERCRCSQVSKRAASLRPFFCGADCPFQSSFRVSVTDWPGDAVTAVPGLCP